MSAASKSTSLSSNAVECAAFLTFLPIVSVSKRPGHSLVRQELMLKNLLPGRPCLLPQ